MDGAADARRDSRPKHSTRPKQEILEVKGRAVVFSRGPRLVALISPCDGVPEHGHAVFLPGLQDGLLGLDYLPLLQTELEKIGWSLVQPLLSSSGLGYGTGSLYRDAAEIDALIRYLVEVEDSKGIILIGHSTGCQDALFYMRHGRLQSHIRALILQGPVSDREWMATFSHTSAFLQLAQEMISQGKSEQLMPREADHAPITAYRYHSLASRMGNDDMFSSDLRPEEQEKVFGATTRAGIPVMVHVSLGDEYIPSTIDKEKILNLFRRENFTLVTHLTANHSLSSPPDAQVSFVNDVLRFVKNLNYTNRDSNNTNNSINNK